MILIVGASGTIGGAALDALVRRGERVRVLLRDPAKLARLAPGAVGAVVQVARGDLDDPPSVVAAVAGAERVFLVTPPGELQAEREACVIDAARRHGVGLLVKVSALGASRRSPLPIARGHAAIEGHLRESGVPFVILRPHHFMQNRLADAETIARDGVFHGTAGDGRIPIIDARDIGEAAAAVLSGSGAAEHAGRVLRLTGPEMLSFADLAATISTVIGRPVRYVDLPPAEYQARLVAAGTDPALAESLVGIQQIYASGRGGEVLPDLEEVLGRPGRTFEEFVSDHVEQFRSGSA
jgi:uncharacterized protein YbjT (DUF2867 family)